MQLQGSAAGSSIDSFLEVIILKDCPPPQTLTLTLSIHVLYSDGGVLNPERLQVQQLFDQEGIHAMLNRILFTSERRWDFTRICQSLP